MTGGGDGAPRDQTTRHAVERAARSCSPRNDAWRLPGCCAKPTSPQATATAVTTTISRTTTQSRSVESIRTTQPTRSAASVTSFPAATNAVPPFASAVTSMSAANASGGDGQHGGPPRIGTACGRSATRARRPAGEQDVARTIRNEVRRARRRSPGLVDRLDERNAIATRSRAKAGSRASVMVL